jgi:hypothetical protein
MWIATIYHTKMDGHLAALWVVVSSTVQFVLGC